jgi:hypothetical protein
MNAIRANLVVTMLMQERHRQRSYGLGYLRLIRENKEDAQHYFESALICAERANAAREMIRSLDGGAS